MNIDAQITFMNKQYKYTKAKSDKADNESDKEYYAIKAAQLSAVLQTLTQLKGLCK